MILKAEKITKTFVVGSNNLPVLKDISFEIKNGEKIAITGPSGSGKSTFLNILSGLEKATSGKVYLDDCDLTSLNDKQLTKKRLENFGFVFQSYHLISTISVLDNILIPVLAQKRKVDIDRIMDICRSLRIDERVKHFPHQLSGGEMQRVCIARAIASNPKIIFSDEATGNLDELNSLIVMDLLSECCNKNNVALLYVTHDMSLTKYADKVAHLDSRTGLKFEL